MNLTEHLSSGDLKRYDSRALNSSELSAARRHLILCAECRAKTAPPTAAEFRAALFGDETAGVRRVWAGMNLRPSLTSRVLGSPWFRLAFAAACVVMITIMTILVLSPRDSNTPLVAVAPTTAPAHVFERPPEVALGPGLQATPPKFDSHTSAGANRKGRTDPHAQRGIFKPSSPDRLRMTNTRGSGGNEVGLPCRQMSESSGAWRTGGAGEVVIRWPKLKGAIRSKLYVSDENERLIDEFESATEFSYVLRQPLNAESIYTWKVIYMMEDGREVSGPSSRFGTKVLTIRSKRGGALPRCSE